MVRKSLRRISVTVSLRVQWSSVAVHLMAYAREHPVCPGEECIFGSHREKGSVATLGASEL